jgi:hypothetical protein
VSADGLVTLMATQADNFFAGDDIYTGDRVTTTVPGGVRPTSVSNGACDVVSGR